MIPWICDGFFRGLLEKNSAGKGSLPSEEKGPIRRRKGVPRESGDTKPNEKKNLYHQEIRKRQRTKKLLKRK